MKPATTLSAIQSDRHDQHSEQPIGFEQRTAIARQIAEARVAQPAWAASPLRHRLKVLRRLRHRIAARPDIFIDAVTLPQRQSATETLAAELLPLADACKWLEREAASVLACRTLSRRSRPMWLPGVKVSEHRDPFGIVLVVATWNYPLFLPGVQVAQALAAGNAVLLKPGRDGTAAAELLRDSLIACGLDRRLLTVLDESPEAAQTAMAARVDKVVLTGSATTGHQVLSQLASTLTPADMELSGCDAVFVRGDADIDLVVKALAFATPYNGGATCIAPRRVFVHRSIADELESRLVPQFEAMPAVVADDAIAARLEELARDATDRGARLLAGDIDQGRSETHVRPLLLTGVPQSASLLKADVFAPVLSLITVDSDEEAIRLNANCPYALGAMVFGRAEPANALAAKLDVGCVVVNDALAPTADPRVAFGGRRQSGYGVTRGAAGLLAMTQPKTVIEQTSNWRPHLEVPTAADEQLMRSYLAAAHGRNWRDRLHAAFQFMSASYQVRQLQKSRSARNHEVTPPTTPAAEQPQQAELYEEVVR